MTVATSTPAFGDSSLASAAVAASAAIGARTAFHPSTETLIFHVTDQDVPAEATVTFTAGARTGPGNEVVLSVSTDMSAQLVVTMADGTRGALRANESVIASRWLGGGRKQGAIVFQLRGAPGTYVIPVRFALSVP
jgi:hypothetical protein